MDREHDDQAPKQPPKPPQDVPPFEPDFDLIGRHDRPPKQGVEKTGGSREGGK